MSRFIRSRIRLAAAAALALPLAGCDDLVGLGDDLPGSYELIRIDDRSLPVELDAYSLSDGTRCELDAIGGSLVLREDRFGSAYEEGEFELQLAYRETCSTRSGRIDVAYPVETEYGSYERESGRIRFYPDNRQYFEDFDATRSGRELTARIGSFRFRFREDGRIG